MASPHVLRAATLAGLFAIYGLTEWIVAVQLGSAIASVLIASLLVFLAAVLAMRPPAPGA